VGKGKKRKRRWLLALADERNDDPPPLGSRLSNVEEKKEDLKKEVVDLKERLEEDF
jgi:hypothetical protein